MVLRLAGVLELELRERNALLVSAGFAAVYPTTPLLHAGMAPVSRAIDLLLAQQEPFGALLIDRCWNVLKVNEGARRLLSAFLDPAKVPPRLASNLVLAALHPEGLRPYVVNWPEVAALTLERVERARHAHPGDEDRHALLEEARALLGQATLPSLAPSGAAPVAVVHLRRGSIDVRLFTLLTTIGTPLDVTAEELTLESLFPADEATERWFRAGSSPSP